MDRCGVLIVGAGFAGLSLARTLSAGNANFLVIEKLAVVGGHSFSYLKGDSRYQIGRHYLGGDTSTLEALGISTSVFSKREKKVGAYRGGHIFQYPIRETAAPSDSDQVCGLAKDLSLSFGDTGASFHRNLYSKILNANLSDVFPSAHSPIRVPAQKESVLDSECGFPSDIIISELHRGLHIEFESELLAIDAQNRVATVRCKGASRRVRYNYLVFTGPLPCFQPLVGLPQIGTEAAGVTVLNCAVSEVEPSWLPYDWVFFDSPTEPITRLGFYKRLPTEARQRLFVEFNSERFNASPLVTGSDVQSFLVKYGCLSSKSTVHDMDLVRLPHAYPIYRVANFEEALLNYKKSLQQLGIYLLGKYADWKISGGMREGLALGKYFCSKDETKITNSTAPQAFV